MGLLARSDAILLSRGMTRGGYYCHIDCFEISKRKTRLIFGVDPEQALKLSFKFLKTMLDHVEVTICDSNHEPLILPYWDDEV